MTADVESMAYTGPVPWHGLGNAVSPGLAPDEMIQEAGLDWTVRKEQMYLSGGEAITTNFALTRYREDKYLNTLGVCGPRYEPIQNREAFKFFKRFTDAGGMALETAGSLGNGQNVWCLASLNEGFTLPGDDRVNGYILMYHPHIWGKALSIMFTPIRVVCQNTLTMALANSSGHFRMPHVQAFDDDIIASATETLGLSNYLLKQFEDQAVILSRTPYTDETVNRYIASLFDKSLLMDEVIEVGDMNRTAHRIRTLLTKQPGAEMKAANDTWWGAFNAVTYYIDHEAGNDRDTALQSAWFGQRAGLKRQALEAALKFAEAA